MRSFSELRLRKAVHRKSISIPFDDRLHVLTSKGEVVKWERCRIHRDMTVFHNFSQVKPVLGKREWKDLVLRTRRHAERHVTLYFFLAIVHFINLGTTILVTAMNRINGRRRLLDALSYKVLWTVLLMNEHMLQPLI